MSKFALLALLGGIILAVWFGQTAIVVLLGLSLAAAGLAWLGSRLSLEGVLCHVDTSESHVFAGECVDLKVQLQNRKLLPLPWVQVDNEVPDGFSADARPGPDCRPGFGLLSKAVPLLWYMGASWRWKLLCKRRGYFELGPSIVTSGDIFGFYPRSMALPHTGFLVVYPRIYALAELGLPPLYPLGDMMAERRICEDLTRTAGVRDYRPQDSLRRIHWRATARRQELQVRVYEPTTTLKVLIFLAVDTFLPDQGETENDFEMGVSVAASVSNHIIARHSQAGLLANSIAAGSGKPVILAPGGTTAHLTAMLEALAMVTDRPSGPFPDFIQTARAAIPSGSSLVFVLGKPTGEIARAMSGLKQAGFKPYVLQVGRQDAAYDMPVPWRHVSLSGDPVNDGWRK